MPVQQKGPSEYQRNYTWHQSRKSRSYSPPLEVLKPAAGVTSNIAAKNLKPAITTKKKVEDIDGKLKTSTEIPKEDEYILLGTNEKFASNVQYRSKSRDRAMNLLKKSKTQPVENGQVKTPLAPRQLAPAPKVKYDPGAPKLRTTTKPAKTEPEKLQKATETQNGEALPKKSALKQVQKSVMKPQNVEAIKSKGQPEKSKQQAVKEKKLANNAKENRPPTAAVSMQKKEQREKKRGKLHESVQTDLEKGVAYSHQEAPGDYALRYKAGLVPPRSRVGPKRVSEYALQYQWRKGVPSSPLLAAEQIVYKSNPQAPPFRPDTMAKANVGPDQRPAAGGESLVNAEDKRLVKESLNPQKLQFPHGKFKY